MPENARPLTDLPERADAAVTDVTTLAHRLRPAVLHAASDHKNATVALHVGRTWARNAEVYRDLYEHLGVAR